MQYISKWHQTEKAEISETHILTATTVMSNETHLYIVMPYCAGGDLCQRVAEHEETRFAEDECRFWFRQILKLSQMFYLRSLDLSRELTFFPMQGLETLQLMQICHRDLSPENMIILGDNKSLMIDFGMCLRIPYSCSGMHLITAQVSSGRPIFLVVGLFRTCGKLPVFLIAVTMLPHLALYSFPVESW